LPGGNVGRTAHNLQRLIRANVHSGNAQLVGIGVLLAGEHMPHHHAAQPALYALNGFYALHLKPNGGKNFACLVNAQLGVNVVF